MEKQLFNSIKKLVIIKLNLQIISQFVEEFLKITTVVKKKFSWRMLKTNHKMIEAKIIPKK